MSRFLLFRKKFWLKVLVDIIPGILFTAATLICFWNRFVGFLVYIVAYAGLTYHTNLVNKYDLTNLDD